MYTLLGPFGERLRDAAAAIAAGVDDDGSGRGCGGEGDGRALARASTATDRAANAERAKEKGLPQRLQRH